MRRRGRGVHAYRVLVPSVVVLAWLAGGAAPMDAGAVEANPNQSAPRMQERRAQRQTTVDAVSRTVMCPSCDTTLDQSSSPAAERMRAWVIAAVEAGWSEEEIRAGLVEEYGGDESVLAAPRAQGSGLVVWVVPGLIASIALAGGAVMLRRWRRGAPQPRQSASSGEAGA